MFVRLLLLTCACALSAAEVPPYGELIHRIAKAYQIVKDNILSMDGNVPLLTDPRRHYAEILYVVHAEAMSEDSCLLHDYYEDYQRHINKAGPFAIAHPQKVVDEVKTMIQDIAESIVEVVKLINKNSQYIANPDTIDEAIDEEINKDTKKYGRPTKILLALGEVAKQIINNHERYAVVSQNLSAHNFIITGAEIIKDHVMAELELYKAVYDYEQVAC